MMRSPLLIIRETEGWVADLLRGTAGAWQWVVREPRDADGCLAALRDAGPSLVVLEVGRDVAGDLALVERLMRLRPETPVVVVVSTGGDLAGAAWDLGATYVLAPPEPRDALLGVVVGLMETARAAWTFAG